MTYNLEVYQSPIGKMYLVAKNNKLCAVSFEQNWKRIEKSFVQITKIETKVLKETKKQLDQYFKDKRKEFNLPYELAGTVFQIKVWEALAKVPFGETKSYKEQGVLIKSPKAVRAIGRTNGLNPLCIILPCHRIIGSNGSLTGYAGGLEIKEFLLKHEGAL